MNFLFDHDGHVYEKHSECPAGDTTKVLCDQVDHHQEDQQPLEPSGDDE